ncbi:rhomboid family intramembrane serine protease [Marinobacter sp. M1N3S26]|uniref:rhomboid family intramembrane serine protease n=1 Tax=Marinobacter sp. M1N3S26 TaxID=3382299 RepID=UPI00387B2DA2
MLIVPAEKKIDWRHPPWMTFALMLSCVLVFVFYQSKDPELFGEAVTQYVQADLDRLEAPIYEDYLERKISFEGQNELQDLLDWLRYLEEEGDRGTLSSMILSDPFFYDYLQDNRAILMATLDRAHWQSERDRIEEQYLSRMSARESGLVPSDLNAYSLVTYQFLHGGWGHLIGNMVVLFLLGFTVERALGAGRYLLAYLFSGAVAGLTYAAFHWGEPVTLVGASGSIAGLMGMYVVFFGLKKIRFFYYLGFYFNYFRAPALVLLPVWLIKELYFFWSDTGDGVAYMAHAGGLAAGAGLILLMGKGWFQARESFYEPEPEEQDEAFTREYAKAMEALSRMDFTLARQRFESLWQAHPDRPVLLEHLYHLDKLRPAQPAYRERAVALMNQYLRLQQPENLLATWQEYLELAESTQPLAPEEHNRVLFAALRGDDLRLAEKAFAKVKASGSADMVREAGRLLAEEFSKRQMEPKANEYRMLLKTL